MSFSLTLSVKRIHVKVTLLLYFLRQVLYTPTVRNGDIMCICMHLKIHLNYLYIVLRTRMDLMAVALIKLQQNRIVLTNNRPP